MFLMYFGFKFPKVSKCSYDNKTIITIHFGLFTIKWFNNAATELMKLIKLENIENIANNDIIINKLHEDYENLNKKYNEEIGRLEKCIKEMQNMIHTLSNHKKDKKNNRQ